jgi:hypothetical protein
LSRALRKACQSKGWTAFSETMMSRNV